MALYGVGLDFNIKRIQLELKLEISRKSGKNIQELQRIFVAMDKNGYGKLDIKEFEQGLAAFGFFPKKVDLQALLKYYDLDKDSQISYSEFLQAMRYSDAFFYKSDKFIFIETLLAKEDRRSLKKLTES